MAALRRSACLGLTALALEALASLGVGAEVDEEPISSALPNFDCVGHPEAEAVFELVLVFIASLTHRVSTGSGRASGWQGEESESLFWNAYAASLLDMSDKDSSADAWLGECPIAAEVLSMAQWCACVLAGDVADERCSNHAAWPLSWIFLHPWGMIEYDVVPVLLNSRWMQQLCPLAQNLRFLFREDPAIRRQIDPHDVVRSHFDCPLTAGGEAAASGGTQGSRRFWAEYLEILEHEGGASSFESVTHRQEEEEYTSSMSFKHILSIRDAAEFSQDAESCSLGLLSIHLQKLLLWQQMVTRSYSSVALGVALCFKAFTEQFLARQQMPVPLYHDTLAALVLSRWPVFENLCTLSADAQSVKAWWQPELDGAQKKPFLLDFNPEEILLPVDHRSSPDELRALPLDEHAAVLRSRRDSWTTAAFGGLIRALTYALAGGLEDGLCDDTLDSALSPCKVVLATIVWGERLARYLPAWVRRVSALGYGRRLLVLCLDASALDFCLRGHGHPKLCVRGKVKTVFNKLTLVSACVHAGVDVVFLDLDTVLLRDPLPAILAEASASGAEVLVTRDFGSQCLNIGVMYLRAHRGTSRFLRALLRWLWRHPYEFDQNAFEGLLMHRQLWNFEFQAKAFSDAVPRWGILDPLNAFVTNTVYHRGIEGWTGSMESILVYHFLDGSGSVKEDMAVRGSYQNLFELFYDNPRIDLRVLDVPLFDQDEAIRDHLLSSRHPSKPEELHSCSMMPADSMITVAEYKQQPGRQR